ncbi:AAA family ATPase [Acinetobacter sp. CAAS 2-6]|uniref:AAA family ATPase n=1 Tax=Acinetobacter sp. CAAS 2-6 TaxID=3016358 RepID=UPI002DD63C3F|nr:AAA family ATPase [Acinetobacter sp. CAAS 2-6]
MNFIYKDQFNHEKINKYLQTLDERRLEWFANVITEIKKKFPNIDIYFADGNGGKGYIGFGIKSVIDKKDRVKEHLFNFNLDPILEGKSDIKFKAFINDDEKSFDFEFFKETNDLGEIQSWLNKVKEYVDSKGLKLNGNGYFPRDYLTHSITLLEQKIHDFLALWPIERLKGLTLENYHQAKNKECFITQIDSFDPTQGDPTFACYFDIWEPIGLGDNDKYHNQKPYSWNKRLGDTEEQAFDKLKQEILDIVDASQRRDLKAIDQIQFTKGLKWMIAFLYQDFNNPFIIPIVSRVNTKRIGYDHLYPKLPLPEFLPLLLADKGEQQFFPYVEKLFAMVRKGYLDNKQKKQQTEEAVDEVMNQQPLNRILFGAAGTGKTFHTINHALSIIENKTLESLEDEDRTALKQRFDEYKDQGQIKFVTFHQSFSYEDFVEGIRAETDEQGKLKYPIKPGVFKEIIELAKGNVQSNIEDEIDLSNKRIWKMSLGRAGIEDDLYRSCLDNNVLLLGWGDAINFSECENIKDIKNKLAEVNYPKDSEDTAAGYVNTFKNKIQNGDLVVITDGNLKFRAIAEVTGQYEYDENQEFGYHQLRKVNWLKTFSPSLRNEDYFKKIFSQSTVYNLENAIDKSKLSALLQPEAKHSSNLENKYVLIVDEINRGNISRIFGELITLIEDSKRAGADEALSVTLPYSKEEFSVPKNVYLIGTMNSSDRSLTGLDVALRRRFTFVEMPPNHELLSDIEIDGLNIGELLKVMNQRIEILLDRDHCIGHANFMTLNSESTVEDLAQIFSQKIIPQLQEYFFDDWAKINLVLFNNGMLQSKSIQNGLFPSSSEEELSYLEQKKIWSVNPKVFNNIETYRAILGAGSTSNG